MSTRTPRPLGIAVIGAGYWGPNLVRNFGASPDWSLELVCDLDLERALPGATHRLGVGQRAQRARVPVAVDRRGDGSCERADQPARRTEAPSQRSAVSRVRIMPMASASRASARVPSSAIFMLRFM